VNPLDHIMQITTQRPTEAEILAANTPLYVPVFGYGDRVNMWRTITNDPDRYDDDNAGTFVHDDGKAYWVRLDRETKVGRFNKKFTNGANNWRIHTLTETKK